MRTRRRYAAGTPEKYPMTVLDYFTLLDAEGLLEQLEALRDFDHALTTWEQAYPVEVFGESLTKDESAQVVAALREAGFTSERVHASWARHIVGCIAESFAPLRASNPAISPNVMAESYPPDEDVARAAELARERGWKDIGGQGDVSDPATEPEER